MLSSKNHRNGSVKRNAARWGAFLVAGGLLFCGGYHMSISMQQKKNDGAKERIIKSVPVKKNSLHEQAAEVHSLLLSIASDADAKHYDRSEEYFSEKVSNNLRRILPVVARLARDADNKRSYELLAKISQASLPIPRGVSSTDLNSIVQQYLNSSKLSADEAIGAFAIVIMNDWIAEDSVEERMNAFASVIDMQLADEKTRKKLVMENAGKRRMAELNAFSGFKTNNPNYAGAADYVIDFVKRSNSGLKEFNSSNYLERVMKRRIDAMRKVIGLVESAAAR